ncbi:tetratricopeptide repeat protein [Ectopseudomonas mendocina]|uniref:Tetratricopeptide repeat protein n=1 Tax=Ectopseudomonas mendocina TaxID=300 RepID=A0ABZ2RDV0_ECTME
MRTFALRFPLALFTALMTTTASAAPNDGDQERVAREMIQVLEAYAVYKMGQFDEAFERYQALADVGNHQGMLNLGNMYAAGLCTQTDLEKALYWYRKAADSGDAIGMYEVARAMDNGLGTPVDKTTARLWYTRAAEGDNTEAQWILGKYLYEEGQRSEGLRWIRSAAHTGGHTTARQFIQALEGNGKTPAPSADELASVKQLFEQMSNAAGRRNASGMVAALEENAQIHIRLPQSTTWQQLKRSELQTLWQQTFDQAKDYSYQRGTPELMKVDDDILAFTVIREQLNQAAAEQTLELSEHATLRIHNGTARIHHLRLDIRQLSD